MKRFVVNLKLLEDVVISERAATEGGHRSLDYIPGANLLGACATNNYSSIDVKEAFDLFHSGKIRFKNAYPISMNGQIGYPIPTCWHTTKRNQEFKKTNDTGRIHLIGEQIHNVVFAETDDDQKQSKIQYAQMRAGYVTESLEYLLPDKSLRMKTAINPNTAIAADAQLFGYQSLVAGQNFRAEIDIDDEIPDNLLNKVIAIFNDKLLLGRSRSAQYGQVECDIAEVELNETEAVFDGLVTVWLTSDLAMQDEFGIPVYPHQANLGSLSSDDFIASKSFLRFRQYSPFNRYRNKYDMERHVLEKGSVLTYRTSKKLNYTVFNNGLGMYRESGLGQVIVNSPLLQTRHPSELSPFGEIFDNNQIQNTQEPNHELVHWLKAKSRSKNQNRDNKNQAKELTDKLKKFYESARRYNGETAFSEIGPSASQWARVEELAKLNKNNKGKLIGALFGVGKGKDNHGVCKKEDKAWGVCAKSGGKVINFSTWLEKITSDEKYKEVGEVITLLARNAKDIVKLIERGEESDA